MSIYNLPYFEIIDLNSLEEVYDGELDFNGKQIDLNLNFEQESINPQKLDIVRDFIINLQNLNPIAIQAIKQDYYSSGIVKDYIEQHDKEFDEHDLSSFINLSDTSVSKKEKILQNIHLKRVGFFPENKNHFAIFDYTINQDVTDYSIVVNFKADKVIDYLDVEN